MAIVYQIKNKINNKSYIGITSRSFKERYPGREWYTSNSINRILKHSVKKHGPEAFEVIIIEQVTVEELEDRERYWIAKLNTKVPNGYNLTNGGESNKEVSEETKKKNSESNKGRTPWNKGKSLTEEHKYKSSKTKKEKYAVGETVPWNKGKKTGRPSKEAIENSAKAHRKPVTQYTIEGEKVRDYDSIKCTEMYGFNSSQVSQVVRGKYKTHKGYIFKYNIIG